MTESGRLSAARLAAIRAWAREARQLHVHDLLAHIDAQAEALETLRARTVVAEHRSSLERLGMSSVNEATEFRLREQLAVTELRAEAAEAERETLRAERDRLLLERDSAREQFDKHVEWASAEAKDAGEWAIAWKDAQAELTRLRAQVERYRAALEQTTAMCRAAITWSADDIQGLRYHAQERAREGMAALALPASEAQKSE